MAFVDIAVKLVNLVNDISLLILRLVKIGISVCPLLQYRSYEHEYSLVIELDMAYGYLC